MGLTAVPIPDKKKQGKRQKALSAERSLESTLWAAADKLRGHMDAAEYKHVVLGLIFLKYISDAFEEHQNRLKEDIANPKGELYLDKPDEREAALEDRDEYIAANIFWVPQEARWPHLRANAKQPTIGKTLDDAMVAIERDNPSLKGVLPKDYARPALDKQRLGEIIDLTGTIGLGGKVNQSRDMLGRVYEYFLAKFASAEGKKGAKESVRAKLRIMVKRILRKYGYPPDKQESATQTVLEQAELLCKDWAG